ncbi:cadherin-like protein 26 isoform X3 [Hippocampus zosterae]|uniref:cadherin-like protein 26 isoform X3 n=1 Tax=Hippocampus zosterae TaxID=109293 RepID=UPI00223CE384|nr:cadherin-like protein 26 isoform X3 [Hippocampus zosterae]
MKSSEATGCLQASCALLYQRCEQDNHGGRQAGSIRMWTFSMLVLALVTSAVASQRGHNIQRDKREILVRSKRRWVLTTIELVEEDPGPYPKLVSQIFNDKTYQHNNHKYIIRGMGVDKEPLGIFSLDEGNGKIYAHKPIDRETHSFFHIKFDILDKQTGRAIDRELAFDVAIKDINDNAPKIFLPQMSADVREDTVEGYLPIRMEVIDPDQENSPNSTVTLSVVSQSPQVPKIDLHQIDPRMAQLTFKGCFDYDKLNIYEVILQAKDHGKPSLSSTAVVTFNIIDTNSHPPMFKARKYQVEIPEMVTRENFLRLAIEDKDTPNTPGWRAKYFIIKGNEENNYKIETDPDTNEGVLSVVKGKDFEESAFINLQIGVENEEPLFVCKDAAPKIKGISDSINVTIKVIDVNDPPQFDKESVDIYEKEEEEPGKLLYTPKVHDVDSDVSKISFVLLDDPADWVSVDKKTGHLRTTGKMDRESPFVHDDIYKIVIAAVDDGEPPASGTSSILVHLLDINDNKPKLRYNSVTMCGNKVMLAAKDQDLHPYGGPYTVSLKSDDATQLQRWKVDPTTGEEVGLVSLKTLAYGNYSVPLVIEDQQGLSGEDTVIVSVCDCEGGNVCRHKQPLSTSLGPASIGLILAALLLFLLIFFILVCECGKQFKHLSEVQQDEGQQTLIKYNQEAGGAECKTVPPLLLTHSKELDTTVRNGLKQRTMQMAKVAPVMIEELDTYNSGMYSAWSANMNTYQGGSLKYQQARSLLSNRNISDYLNRRLHEIDGNPVDHPEYQPHKYMYEEEESGCQSLEGLSFSGCGEDFLFMNDLGPKFKHFGSICNQLMQEKGTHV